MAMVRFEGVIVIEASVVSGTVKVVVSETFPRTAEIVVGPAETAVTIPCEVIVATEVEDELQLADGPRSGVAVPSV